MKRGDHVLVWGNRLAIVKRVTGTGSKVWSSGKRLPIAGSAVYPKTGRILLELVDGVDPPVGYSAWWPVGEIEPLTAPYQMSLPFRGKS